MKTPEELAEQWAKLESANLDIDCDVQNGADYATVCSECRHIYYAAIRGFLAGYAAAQPKWISVKERLPEFDKDGYTEHVLLRRYDGAIFLTWFKKRNGLVTGGNIYRLDQITHWMPLPEPPKEDE